MKQLYRASAPPEEPQTSGSGEYERENNPSDYDPALPGASELPAPEMLRRRDTYQDVISRIHDKLDACRTAMEESDYHAGVPASPGPTTLDGSDDYETSGQDTDCG